jgi:hypothetical protein
MSEETKVVGFVSSLIGIGIGILIGGFFGDLVLRKEAVESGHAHYSERSGEFEFGPPVAER